ncbi:hypothetical protein ACFYPC_11170 [Streptomyces sp. NPDC005808]|uniref:hypothetical protein n=1 Tax=Streptomyces sp. NPDC005808 TaxID=3364734 RepID=UPI0036ACD108
MTESLPRPARRPDTPESFAEACLYADDHIGSFSVTAVRLPARPTLADKRYGLDPLVDRERYGRLPGYRLRGTTPDPLDFGASPGRGADILYEGRTFPVVSSFTLEQSQAATGAMVARFMAAPGVPLHDGSAGRLVRHGRIVVMHRRCRQCGEAFTSWRFLGQRRRWPTFCSADHRTAYKRVQDRQRQRERRAAN